MISLCLAVGLGLLIIYLFSYNKIIREKLENNGDTIKDASANGNGGQDVSGVTLDLSSNPVKSKIIFEGTDVIVVRGNKCCGNEPPTLERQEYYTDYEKSYSNTTSQYPDETIRFDLLTPIPYSDAFAAPMGPRSKPKDPTDPYLAQISYTPTFKA